MTEPVRLKILVTGPHKAGKSCLIKNYCEGKHVQRYLPTIGIDYGVRTIDINGQAVKINFFDASGDEEFKNIRTEFYAQSQAIIFVADASNEDSFEAVLKFMNEAEQYSAYQLKYLILSKIDVSQKFSDQQTSEFAKKNGLKWFKCSSLTGENIQTVFNSIFKDVYNQFVK